MKKIKYLLLLLLLLPITTYARTPNKEETLKVIENIENVQVDDSIKIYNVEIQEDKIVLNINNNGNIEHKNINYSFDDKGLSFSSGTLKINNNKIENIEDNIEAFYLYSILENISTSPYDIDNYYNNDNIIKKIENQEEKEKTYIETSKTFGLTITKNNNEVKVVYHYYYEGDNPVMLREVEDDLLKNPETGNYSLLINGMLLLVISLGIYTYISPKRIKGE